MGTGANGVAFSVDGAWLLVLEESEQLKLHDMGWLQFIADNAALGNMSDLIGYACEERISTSLFDSSSITPQHLEALPDGQPQVCSELYEQFN